MTRSLIFDADLELARATASGLICLICQAQFSEAHNEPVACEYCWPKLDVEERASIARATHRESNRLAWSKKMRARKESKWAGFALAPRTGEETENR